MKNNKKGAVWLYLILIGFVVALTFFFIWSSPKGMQRTSYIGEAQLQVLKASVDVEEMLFYLDNSAFYAAFNAVKDLVENGFQKNLLCGFYSTSKEETTDEDNRGDENDNIQIYVGSKKEFEGYTIIKDTINYKEGECEISEESIIPSFKLFYYDKLDALLNIYENFKIGNYNIEVKNEDNLLEIEGFAESREEVLVGEKDTTPSVGTVSEWKGGYFDLWPVENKEDYVSSCFGYRGLVAKGASTYHKGIDIKADKYTPVLAVAPGKVVALYPSDGGIVIQHKDNLKTEYLHLYITRVKIGDSVSKGQVVGLVGGRGEGRENRWPPHLHFMVILNNEKINPMCFFDKSIIASVKINTDSLACKGDIYSSCKNYDIGQITGAVVDEKINKNSFTGMAIFGTEIVGPSFSGRYFFNSNFKTSINYNLINSYKEYKSKADAAEEKVRACLAAGSYEDDANDLDTCYTKYGQGVVAGAEDQEGKFYLFFNIADNSLIKPFTVKFAYLLKDDISPPIVKKLEIVKEGEATKLKWEKNFASDTIKYKIYYSKDAFDSTSEDKFLEETTGIENIEITITSKGYYIVTAVDEAGNDIKEGLTVVKYE